MKVRVTVWLRDGATFIVDDVKKVSQLVQTKMGQEELVTAWGGKAILSFPFFPWRSTIIEGEAKICSVSSLRVEAIEAELIAEREKGQGDNAGAENF